MTDNIENVVIEHLKALRGEIKEFRSKHDADMADIKHRLTSLGRSQTRCFGLLRRSGWPANHN